MKKASLAVLTGLIAFSCSLKNWDSGPGGVTVSPSHPGGKTARAIQIVPLSEEIIKVAASAGKTFSNDQGLVVPTGFTPAEYELKKLGDTLIITTAEIEVKVLKTSGEVAFFDHSGKLNYKGKNEELYQYNTKVSVPFDVSTQNYGLFWDNYSFSCFGDLRPYGQLDQFSLFGNNGEEGGLTATYLDDREKDHLFKERKETAIDYENLTTIRNFPKGFDFRNANITWEGDLQPHESGVFNFFTLLCRVYPDLDRRNALCRQMENRLESFRCQIRN